MKTLEGIILEESGLGYSMGEVKLVILDLKVILRRITMNLEGVVVAIAHASSYILNIDARFDDLKRKAWV